MVEQNVRTWNGCRSSYLLLTKLQNRKSLLYLNYLLGPEISKGEGSHRVQQVSSVPTMGILQGILGFFLFCFSKVFSSCFLVCFLAVIFPGFNSDAFFFISALLIWNVNGMFLQDQDFIQFFSIIYLSFNAKEIFNHGEMVFPTWHVNFLCHSATCNRFGQT